MELLEEQIKKFLEIKSSGCGSGSGSGSGDGYADGSGYGSGVDESFIYGRASSYGDGSGSGDGYGSDSGDGYCYVNSYNDGYGLFKIKSVNKNKIYDIDGIPTILFNIKGNVAKGEIVQKDLSFKKCFIVRNENYFAHGETLKEANESLIEKIFENIDVEEKIEIFIKEFDLKKKYPAEKFYEWHKKLTGSCKMGRDNFMKNHEIKMTDKFTVEEFIKLTENDFGSEIIKQLKDRIKEQKS